MRAGVATVPWLAAHSAVVAGVVVGVAGAYQFGPWKTRCLTACRSPRGFAARHWHELKHTAAAATDWDGAGRALSDALARGGLSTVWTPFARFDRVVAT